MYIILAPSSRSSSSGRHDIYLRPRFAIWLCTISRFWVWWWIVPLSYFILTLPPLYVESLSLHILSTNHNFLGIFLWDCRPETWHDHRKPLSFTQMNHVTCTDSEPGLPIPIESCIISRGPLAIFLHNVWVSRQHFLIFFLIISPKSQTRDFWSGNCCAERYELLRRRLSTATQTLWYRGTSVTILIIWTTQFTI